MTANGRRVGIYVRISRDREGSEHGVTRQADDCKALAEQFGWRVVDTYKDNDVSASDRRKKRMQYLRLLADLDRGRIDTIIVWHMDRLHRQPAELEDFMSFIAGRDIRIHTVKSGEVDPNSDAGQMVLRMLGAAAKYEVDHKRTRIKRKAEEIAAAGKVSGGGDRPFGYEDDRVTVREAEAVEIREAAKRVLNGASLYGVARDMNKRGVATVNEAGHQRGDRIYKGQWTPPVLRRILVSPRYAGLREHRGQVTAKAVWEPILDIPTHEALRRLLLDESRRTNGGSGNRKNLLVRVLRCGGHQDRDADHVVLCGEKMISRPAFVGPGRANVHSYVCPTTKLRIKGDDIDNYVARMLMERLTGSKALAQALKKAGDLDVSHSRAVADVTEATEKLDELEQDYRRTGTRITRVQYLEARAALEAELDDAQRRALETSGQTFLIDIPRDPAVLKAAWEANEATPEWRWTLVESMIEKVIIGPGIRGLNKFDPDRVAIRWKF